ncbi:hypothetical protein TCSYLVIO_006968 [Trypanosoma cruzi]|nr:hypothetical protein TCSYLVIO_006968 [Trypanosoma cruzi]
MVENDLGVREALSAPPFAAFCEFRTDEPPRRGCLAALCGGGSDMSQRPAPPSFEQHYKSRHPLLPTTVEAYGRSAAGVVVEPSHLRNPVALEKTMHFLVHHYLRDPHTPAVFLAPFDVWRYLWDRMRQVRTNWVPQLPPVGTQSLSSHDYADGVLPASVRESKRRLKWLEFTVTALAVGGANLCRTVQGCGRYMADKQNFLESIAQCFSDLVLSYRAEQRLRNSEMFSAILLFYGLSQLTKVENRAGFCQVIEVQVAAEGPPTHVFEPPSSSVDFGSVYRELAYLPQMARTQHVRTVLKLIHSWCQREWFRFFHLCRTEPLTVLQRAMVFHSFSYARFRAVVDLVTANSVVYGRARLRGEMTVADLADLLLMEEIHCVDLLETMGLGAQLSEDRTILRVARPDSSPYITQEAIYRHLEDTSGKPRLCLPTLPSFFGFTVWRHAFELFPDAFGDDPIATHGDLSVMSCPVNLMRLLEPYCPPYNDDVAALELTDAGDEWFAGVQAARERMLTWYALHMSSHGRRYTTEDENDEDHDDDGEDTSEGSLFLSDKRKGLSQEQLKAFVQAMDQESQSTHSSVFNDDAGSDREGDDDNAELVEDEPEEVMGTSGDTEHEALEENDEAVRAAKALLTSLHGDPIYAKIEKELQAMAKDEASVAASGNAPLNTAAPSQYSSDASRPDITNENDDDNNNNNDNDNDMVTLNLERASGPQHTAGPWLSLPPPEFTVCVSPLPTDYPGEMSPNLRAIVETPKSLTTAPTDLEEAPLLQEDVGVSRVAGAAENRGEVSPRPPLPTRKATASFPSFPPLPGGLHAVSFGASHAPQEMSVGEMEQPRAKRQRGEAVLSCDDVSPSKPPAFFSPQPPREEGAGKQSQPPRSGQSDDASSFCFSSLENSQVILPFEEEERRRQRIGNSAAMQSQPPRHQAHMEVLPQESLPEVHGMRKVTFVTSPAAPSELPQPSTTKPAGNKPRAPSYRDTVRACLNRRRKVSAESDGLVSFVRTSWLTQKQQQPLLSASTLGEPVVSDGTNEPRWMYAFMSYLLEFFTTSYEDAVACRFLSEVLCSDPEARARGVAGWFCRGFTPTMVPCMPQHFPSGAMKSRAPMLQLASTVIVFGSGMRDDCTDDAGLFFWRHSVSRASLLGSRRASASMRNFAAEDAFYSASAMWPLSLGRWVTALLLPQEEGASLLARDTLYSVENKDEDYDDDDEIEGGRDSNHGGELVGLWEQLHSVQMSTASHLTPAAEWSRQPSSQLDATQEAAAWCYSRQHSVAFQTQLALYGIDYRDTPLLRWMSGEKEGEGKDEGESSTSTQRPVENITAVITIDTSNCEEYEEGLCTLRLLIRQAVEKRTVFLSGVLIVLYTPSEKEEMRLQQAVEKMFWTTWQQCAEQAAAPMRRGSKTREEVTTWRSAYQRTMRRSVGSVKKKLQTNSPKCNTCVKRPRGIQSNGKHTTRNKFSGFFTRGDKKDEPPSTVCAEEIFAFDATPSYPPSPILVVLPIRTAVENGTRQDRVGRDKHATGDVTGGGFAANNAEVLRTALLQAINSLLQGYEAKWKEFLRQNDMGARETVLRVN